MCVCVCIYTLPVKSIKTPLKKLFLFLNMLFLMKNVEQHSGFIHNLEYK